MKYKVGDRVKFVDNEFSNYYDDIENEYIKHGSTTLRIPEYNDIGCTIVAISNNRYVVKAPTTTEADGADKIQGYTQLGFNESKLVLLRTNIKLNMNLKEKFITAFLSEPEKSFRKVGITNGDGVLTTEGQEIFFTWLLKNSGDKFKKEVVDVLLEEENKK